MTMQARVRPSFLVSHELSLEEAGDANKHFDARFSLKLLVRLEAKPGKEEEVANFLRGDRHWFRTNQARPHGSQPNWDRRHSESSTPSPMKLLARPTFRAKSPPR